MFDGSVFVILYVKCRQLVLVMDDLLAMRLMVVGN